MLHGYTVLRSGAVWIGRVYVSRSVVLSRTFATQQAAVAWCVAQCRAAA